MPLTRPPHRNPALSRAALIGAVVLCAIATPAHAALDGKVAGLNEPVFAALAEIKKRNPGALTEVSARQLAAAINKDGQIDAAERDLLEELTQSMFRSITVTPPSASLPAGRKVMSYPTSGNAKKILQDVLNPPLDLEAAWTSGQAGWNSIIAEYKKSPDREAGTVAFVQGKLAEQWAVSNLGNGYKPLRDMIAQRYGFSHAPSSDANTGRLILYKSMIQLDRSAKDGVPDFLYNWTRPGGYL